MPRSRAKSHAYKPTRGQFAGRSFRSDRAYRDALARGKGFRDRNEARRAYRSVRSTEGLAELRPVERQKRNDALEVLNLMRSGKRDLGSAVKQFNAKHPDSRITSQTVKKYAGTALRKKGSHLVAKPYDRLLRIMRFPTAKGVVDLEIRDSRSATLIGQYWNAMKHYEKTGDAKLLRPFRGKSVRSGKQAYPFLVNVGAIGNLGDAGEFDFEDIYEALASP